MGYVILSKESGKQLSQRKLETYDKYCRIIRWGRRFPIEFCRVFLGVELLDYQKYAIWNSWTAQFVLWCWSRAAGKSTVAAIYLMLRCMLFPFYNVYIVSNVGQQAKETFMKLEDIAKQRIATFVDSTNVFLSEVLQNSSTGDGFTHSPESFRLQLFNGSSINTLNSDPTNAKGRRGSVLVDEAGWTPEELLVQCEQFANLSENFKLGGNIDVELEPLNFPTQLIYTSSASDTESAYYKKYKEFTRQMLIGNPSYFACSFDVSAVMAATKDGKPIPVPLISQDKVDRAMRDSPEKGQRELYNHFSSETHEGQILTRRDIMLHTKDYLPILRNETGVQQFLLSWDSARLNDNSVIEAAEVYKDPQKGWCMRLGAVHSLVDRKTKNKTPLNTPAQMKEFKKLLLAYNGTHYGKLDYENILCCVLDAGAAGGMLGNSDYLLDDWEDDYGVKHRGLIDTSHKANETNKYTFLNAVDILKLLDPKGNRNDIFASIESMVKLGVVEFPTEYEIGKEYVSFMNEDGTEVRHELSNEEVVTLSNIELLKTEIITMCKYTNQGSISYNFPSDKRNKMHDDRVFAFGLLCWKLAQLRHGDAVTKEPDPIDPNTAPTFATAVDFD